MNITPKFDHGDVLTSHICGFKGTVTAIALYDNGCVRYKLEPKVSKDGEYREEVWFDEQHLEKIKTIKKKVKVDGTGGYRNDPKMSNP